MQKLINAIEKYVTLSDADISVIEQLFFKKVIRMNDSFLQAGEICKEFVFIEHGLLRHFMNNDGKEETFFFSAENDFVCDYESFINKVISNKTIVALEDTATYSISYNNMQEFYRKVSVGDKFGRRLLEDIFPKTIRHLVTTFTQPAEKRYQDFLLNFKHVQSRIPQYYIASFIGVTPQSLSRIRRQLFNN